jgi:hypothetical protein
MNERTIKMLIESGLLLNTSEYRVQELDPKIKKLIELVVKECMLICGAVQGAGEIRNMHEFASGAAQCKVIIKRDFGVEE